MSKLAFFFFRQVSYLMWILESTAQVPFYQYVFLENFIQWLISSGLVWFDICSTYFFWFDVTDSIAEQEEMHIRQIQFQILP